MDLQRNLHMKPSLEEQKGDWTKGHKDIESFTVEIDSLTGSVGGFTVSIKKERKWGVLRLISKMKDLYNVFKQVNTDRSHNDRHGLVGEIEDNEYCRKDDRRREVRHVPLTSPGEFQTQSSTAGTNFGKSPKCSGNSI